MNFRTAYGEKNPVQTFNTEKSMAKQAMKDESDINFIMKKFQKTGIIQHQKEFQGNYGDFAAIDYHEAMNIVVQADQMFDTVPSSVRKRFGNDPGTFLEFVTDEANHEEMRNMGLLAPLLDETSGEGRNEASPPAESPPAEPPTTSA